MKDVVFLVVDSLMADHVFTANHGLPLTPFLESVRDRVLFFSNVYAQGPFTEAGTKGLLTGVDTLDDGGYLFRYDASRTFLTNVFKDRGFDTYSLIYPTCLYSDWILSKLDRVYYTSGMMFDVFWNQKIEHYIKLYDNGQFDRRDLEDCVRLMRVIFKGWLHFLDPANKEEKSMLRSYDAEYDYAGKFALVSEQYRLFEADAEQYVFDMFRQGKGHELNSVRSDFIPNLIRLSSIKTAFDGHKKFQKKLRRKQFLYNLKNNRIKASQIREMLARVPKGINKYTFGEFEYMMTNLLRGKDMKTCVDNRDYKLLLSAHSQIRKIGDLLVEDHDVPRFVTAHVEEPHYFTTFFSFDSDDSALISDELDYAEQYVDSLTSGYRGLISYDLAVRYVDREISFLFDRLKKAGKLDNTVVVVTADHGSSYNICPPRGRTVNNCHTENYRIPVIIYDSEINGRAVDCLSSNKDIIPTLLDHLKLQPSEDMTGVSLLADGQPRRFVTTEYMGTGCPDMRRNRACITVRSKKYMLACETKLTEGFHEEDITGIFDLEKDPLELHGEPKLRNEEIDEMIGFLKRRIDAIRENNRDWLEYKGEAIKR